MSAVGDAPELQLDAPREEVLQRAVSLISQAWNSFDQARPGQPIVDDDLRAVLREPLPDTPEPVTRALEEAAQILDESIAQPRPRYFAFVGSSGLPIGVVADALASCFDANMAVYAGAASDIEEQAVRWVGELVGYPVGGGAFTSGGTISNLTALAAARERALPGARAEGMGGLRAAVYCSAEAHYSVMRAAELLGIGAANVRPIGLDADRRDGAGRGGRGARPRSCRGRHAGRRDRDGRHHADRRGRSDRAPGRSLPRARGVAARGRRLRAGGRLPARDRRPVCGARPGRLGIARRPQVALPAEGLRRDPGAKARGSAPLVRARRGLPAA